MDSDSNKLPHERIDSCYDSHVHWAATGEFADRLRLESLVQAADLLKLDKPKSHGSADWLLGFGWNENGWPDKQLLHRDHLDKWCSDRPVLLTRIDAHAGWANTLALKMAGWLNDSDELLVPEPAAGRIGRDAKGRVTGVLVDQAYEQFRRHLPSPQAGEVRRHLLKAVQIFHGAGFTHIRDVGGSPLHWNQALLLDRAQVLNLAVEMFFHLDETSGLDDLCTFIESAKRQNSPNLRARGVKIFLDGALGSEGAWISQPYSSGSGQGLQILNRGELRRIFQVCAVRKIEVAVHTIGDAAVHQVIELASELKAHGLAPHLHLEHVEIARPETIELMKGLEVECHLQPSHWLSDSAWLKDKVGDQLYGYSFPWRRLQEAAIPFDFGSDTPIEPPSVERTLRALSSSSENGIPKLLGSPHRLLSHPDRTWAANSFTIFEGHQPVQVVFRGDHLS